MAKLYFKYGAMGSSKSAQALITKFNYEELGMSVWLIKPSVDTRDGANIIKSRIGLCAEAQIITPEEDIVAAYRAAGRHDVIIADEAQFFTPAQIDGLRALVDEDELPVLCFGLRTDFLTHLPAGAKPPSTPASTSGAASSPRAARSSSAATTATSPCAINAGSSASGDRAESKCEVWRVESGEWSYGVAPRRFEIVSR